MTAVCYECLTGDHPPDSLQRMIYDEYETLQEKHQKVPPKLESLLKKGLAVWPEERYESMGDLLYAMNGLVEEKTQKKGKWIGLCVLFVILLCGGDVILTYQHYKEKIFFDFEETESFCFVKGKDTYMDDFNSDFYRIEERIKILAGDKPYIWEKENDEFHGTLPLSCFGSEDPREIIRDLLARPCDWTICGVEIDPKYIESIGFIDSEKKELEILLSEELPDKKQKDLKELAHDEATLSVDHGYNNYLALKGKRKSSLSYTWDLSEKWKENKIRELFAYNISQDALKLTLDVYTQIQAEWETKASGMVLGKKQCSPEDLSEETVTLEYWQPYEDDRTEGEVEDFVRGLKKRLDLLEIPYVIGRERNHSQRIVLRVNQQDYNEDLFWLLLRINDDLRIQDTWGAEGVSSYYIPKINPGQDPLKKEKLMINIPKEEKEAIREARKWVEGMEKRGTESFYLMANGLRILKEDLNGAGISADQMKQGRFTFSSLCMKNKELGGENEKVIKLLNEIISSKYNLSIGRDLFAYQFSDAETLVASGPKKSNKKYRFSFLGEKEIMEKIQSFSDQYEVVAFTDYQNGERNLRIMLSSQIYSESILDSDIAFDQICKIIDACKLEQKAIWNQIVIGVMSRYKEDKYAARLILNRVFGGFLGGRKKPYSISFVAYQEEEGKWLKKIYKKIKAESRYKGFKFDYENYSDYIIY